MVEKKSIEDVGGKSKKWEIFKFFRIGSSFWEIDFDTRIIIDRGYFDTNNKEGYISTRIKSGNKGW